MRQYRRLPVRPGATRRSGSRCSDGRAVHPDDGRRADGVTERFELVVPGLAQGETQFAVQLDDARARGIHGGADAVLWYDDVAGGVRLGMEDAEVGRVQPAAAVDAVPGVLGHLESEVLPATQGRSDGSTSTRCAFPVIVRALRPAQHRL